MSTAVQPEPDPDSLLASIRAARSAQFPVAQSQATRPVQSDDTAVAGPEEPDPDKVLASIRARKGQIETLHDMSGAPFIGPAAELGARALESVDPNSAAGKLLGMNATIADQAVHGATYGFAPKIAGLMAMAQKGNPLAYAATRDAWRDRYQNEQTAQPVASTAGDVLGSAASPVNLLLPGSGAAKTVLGTVAKAATSGAAAGTLRSVGETVGSAGDYTRNALLAAAMGFGTGATFGTAGQFAGKIAAPGKAAVDRAYGEMRLSPPLDPGQSQAAATFNDLINKDPDWLRAYQSASANAARRSGRSFPSASSLGQNAIPMDVIDATQREFYALNQAGKVGSGSKAAVDAAEAQRQSLLSEVDAENPLYAAARGAYRANQDRAALGKAAISTLSKSNPLSLVAAPATAPGAALLTMMGQDAASNLPARFGKGISPAAAALLSEYLTRHLSSTGGGSAP